MKFLAITMFCAGVIAMFMKIRLHLKLLEPQRRNQGQLWKYFGFNFLLPVLKNIPMAGLKAGNYMLTAYCSFFIAAHFYLFFSF